MKFKKVSLWGTCLAIIPILVSCAPFHSTKKSPQQVKMEQENKRVEAILTSIYNQLQQNKMILTKQKLLATLEGIKNNPWALPRYKCIATTYELVIAFQDKNFPFAKRIAKQIEDFCSSNFILQFPRLQTALAILKYREVPLICTFSNLDEKVKKKCFSWAKKEVLKACDPKNPQPSCKCFANKNIKQVAACYLGEEYKPPIISPVF